MSFTTTRSHAARHRFTSSRRLQCSPFTLALRNNRYEGQPTGGFNQHFQLCSPKYIFTYKAPWELRPQLCSGIIIINLSHHLVRMAKHTTMSSEHLPILIELRTTATSSPARHRTYINLNKADWTQYRQEIECKLSPRHLPTDCQKDEKLFRATQLKAASHYIPTGRCRLYTQQVPAEILVMMEDHTPPIIQGSVVQTTTVTYYKIMYLRNN